MQFHYYHKSLLKYVFSEVCPDNPLDSQDSLAANQLEKVKKVA